MARRVQVISDHLAPSQAEVSNKVHVPTTVLQHKSSAKDASHAPMPVLIGAMVIDIHSFPSQKLRPGTTIIGKVKYNFGGVARNVAECMMKLGCPSFLISIVGDDMSGHALLNHWTLLGLPTKGIKVCPGSTTPVITATFNEDGDIAAGVADTEELEKKLTPEWILKFADVIQQAPVLLLDANLLFPSLEAACQSKNANVPVWFEPVSVPKSVRAAGLLQYLTYVSPNEEELLAMAKAVSSTAKTPEECIEVLMDVGVGNIVLTLGSQGLLLCKSRNRLHIPAVPATVVSTSGAGDCLVGGSLVAICSGSTSQEMMAYGVAVAKQAVESPKNVPEIISKSQVVDDVKVAMGKISTIARYSVS